MPRLWTLEGTVLRHRRAPAARTRGETAPMSHRPAETPATPGPAAETSNEKVASPPSPPTPGITIPTRDGFAIHRDRMRDSQGEIDRHRTSVQEGLQKLQKQLEATPEFEVDKRLSIRNKIKTFEDQLEQIGEEQASLDRKKAAIAREEEQ